MRREDKYKAKSFIDTFVYRVEDQVGAWSYPLLTWLGLGLTGISFVAASLAAGRCVLSLWLGRRQAALARQSEEKSCLYGDRSIEMVRDAGFEPATSCV